MRQLVLLLFGATLAFLFLEARFADRHRRQLEHVVYVNGTRGKSSVTRLIDAGLRASGKRVFCKTTGTLPMTIDVQNEEREIIRRGKANIKEQLMILRKAAEQGAQLLVAECMAVSPVLQHSSQHRMLRADIGVLTNVRLDHTEEMGHSLEEICDALCSTIPKGGVLFTAEQRYFSRIEGHARALGATAILVSPGEERYTDIDFAENVSLALAVCEHLGVEKEAALLAMQQYKRDPYALSLHRFSGGALFINALSVNDPQSSCLVYENVLHRLNIQPKRLILLLNNRPDRGYRTEHMLLLTRLLQPQSIWLLGASQRVVRRRLRQDGFADIVLFSSACAINFSDLSAGTVVFAAGNLADEGSRLVERIKKEGTPYVS